MASKWINKDLFNDFQNKKKEEKEKPAGRAFRSDLVWKTPEKGTVETAKVYEGRFVPDPKGRFYEKYYYHMFKSGETWSFSICPKTFDFEAFCPFCLSSQLLYTGSQADKKKAPEYARKTKFVGNFFIIDDPRDAETEEDKKVNGTVKLYEFPGKVEIKLKEEITDTKNGLGYAIFDPGKEGYNFILKVLSTKRDKNNKEWPEYGNSTFARKSSPLGTDKEIDAIMKTANDLMEYLNDSLKTDEEIKDILKKEVLWDLVKDEWNRSKSAPTDIITKDDDIDDSIWDDEKTDTTENNESEVQKNEEEEDADLLKELDNL